MQSSVTPSWYLRIPPPVWMLVMLLCAFGIDRAFGSIPFAYAPLLAMALAAIGIGIDIWAFLAFRLAGTEIIPVSASNKTLVAYGPFRFSRNPMYLGLILLGLAIALYAGTLAFLAVPVLLFVLCNAAFIPFEEAKMARQFKNQYTDYCAGVRRWI